MGERIEATTSMFCQDPRREICRMEYIQTQWPCKTRGSVKYSTSRSLPWIQFILLSHHRIMYVLMFAIKSTCTPRYPSSTLRHPVVAVMAEACIRRNDRRLIYSCAGWSILQCMYECSTDLIKGVGLINHRLCGSHINGVVACIESASANYPPSAITSLSQSSEILNRSN